MSAGQNANRQNGLFDSKIAQFELELNINLSDRINNPDFSSFTELLEEIDLAIERKYGSSSADFLAQKKQRIKDIVGLAAEYVKRGGIPMPQNQKKNDGNEMPSDNKYKVWYLVIGCIFAVSSIVMAFWAFGIGNLTPDQRQLLRWLLPLASGIAAGGFTGFLSVNSKLLVPATVGAAGGFGIWLLSVYVLFPNKSPSVEHGGEFAVTIYFKNELGNIIDQANGELTLELGNLLPWKIEHGQSLPRGIPSDYGGKKIHINCHIDGYEQLNPSESFVFSPNAVIEIKLKKTSP